MIYEAKRSLCIGALLFYFREEQIKSYISICDELGLSALVETHDEMKYKPHLHAGARARRRQ